MNKLSMSHRVALVGLMAAMAAALSFLESLLPSVGLPGVRLGLSNIAVTAAMVVIGVGGGCATAVVKVLFVLLTRGAAAFMLSATGTVLAVVMTLLLLPLYQKEKMTFVGVSVTAAAAHSMGQLSAASWLMSKAVLGYAPLMLIVSVPTGVLTGLILNGIVPRLTPALRRSVEKG